MTNLANDPTSSPTSSPPLAEMIAATIVLGVLMTAQIVVTHATALFHQTAWLDEVHTLMIVDDPDPAKFHSALSDQCVDKNFPVYYQILRQLRIQSPQAIRAVSLASTFIGLIGIYYLLRGSFTPLESAVGVLAVWSTPLIVYHSFQARFYIPWFAAVVSFAAALQWEARSRHKLFPRAFLAVSAFLACTLHGLGLPAIALVAAAEMIFNHRPIKQKLVALLPALPGPIAVALYIPLLREQIHSFVIPSWLVGNPVRLLYSTLGDLLPGLPSAVLILGIWATVWCRRFRATNASDRQIPLAPVAGLSALMLFPFVLFAISLLSQPVLLARYAIVSAAAFAPAAAYVASRMRRSIALVLCLILALETSAELVRRVRDAGAYHDQIASLITTIRAQPNVPALFEARHQLFPVTWAARDLVDRCAYLDFQPGPNQPDPIVEGSERDFAKKFQHVFGWPHVMPWDQVISLPKFILISLDDDADRINKRFAGYSVNRLGPQQYELSR